MIIDILFLFITIIHRCKISNIFLKKLPKPLLRKLIKALKIWKIMFNKFSFNHKFKKGGLRLLAMRIKRNHYINLTTKFNRIKKYWKSMSYSQDTFLNQSSKLKRSLKSHNHIIPLPNNLIKMFKIQVSRD